MKGRPNIIVFLTIMYLLEPFAKLSFYSWFHKTSPFELIYYLKNYSTGLELIQYFLLVPLAGICIYLVKKWTYYVFLIIEIYILFVNIDYLMSLFKNNQWITFCVLILIAIMNIGVVTYFLLPMTRKKYSDPKLRWWESALRYGMITTATITHLDNQEEDEVEILDISETGAFITNLERSETKEKIMLSFEYEDHFLIKGEIINDTSFLEQKGHGIKFVDMSPIQLGHLRLLMAHLEKSGRRRGIEKRDLIEEMMIKLKTIIRSHI